MSDERSDKEFFFIGNHVCLDFVNTQIVQSGEPVDLLNGFGDLISWLVQAHVLDAAKARDRFEIWSGSREAERTVTRAQDFRGIVRNMLERIVANKPVPQAAIAQINELLRSQVGHGELKRVRDGFEKRFLVDFKEPVHLLGPVAESASDLLAYGNLSLIRKCENPPCVLFFYDTTKNHSRRWCSMSACGNRIKVAAHYRRLRNNEPAPQDVVQIIKREPID